jgi:hypothetical protein
VTDPTTNGYPPDVIALAAALGVNPDQIQIPSLEDIVPEQLPIPKDAAVASRGLPIRSIGKFVGKMLGKTVTDAAGYAAGGATVAVLTPVLQDIVNESWSNHPNRPLPAHDAAAAVERGEMTLADAAAEAKFSGYDGTRFNIMEKLAGLAPSPTDLMTMFRRKVIGADLLRKGLVQGNVRTEWADYLTQITETLLSPGELANAVVQGIMQAGEATGLAEKDGVTSDSFDTLVKLAGNPPGAEQLLALWNRKVINSAEVDKGLRQSHLKPEWIGAVKALAQHVPSVSDMVRFGTREAYGGGSELSGTAAELPGAFVDDAKRQGLAESDAEHYWAAHWHLPSPTQAYQMLHRKLINASTLSELLRVSDYPPFWRDKLASIAYHVPTRVDLRRMLEHGVIDEARVHKGYLDLGYTEGDAAILTKFAVELAKGSGSSHPAAREASATDLASAYEGRYLSRSEFIDALRGLRYPAEVASMKADAVDARAVRAARVQAAGGIHTAYKKGNITAGAASGGLSGLGFTSQQVAGIMSAWSTEKDTIS